MIRPGMNRLALLKLVLVSSCALVSGSFVLHDSRRAPPAGYVGQGAALTAQAITFRVGLSSTNIAGLEAKLQNISNPSHPDYGKWLSADDVKTFVQPAQNSSAAFTAFARANNLNVTVVSDMGEWIQFTTTVAHANKLFNADYQAFENKQRNITLIRTLAYSLPAALVGHVDTVIPTTSFDAPNTRLAPVPTTVHSEYNRRWTPQSCNSTITPSCLQNLYEIPRTPAFDNNNSLLVTGYEDAWAQTVDLSVFLTRERTDMNPNTSYTVVSISGGTDEQGPYAAGTEADLDIEYTVGLATDVPITFLTVGGFSFTQALLDTTTYLASAPDPPSVMTTSYGAPEDTFAPSDAQKICAGYMALGARGISVIFASGDGGVRGNHDDLSQCTNNTFNPVFPATCPYVTAVGSTLGINPERAINFTGGGFSNYFARPWWQNSIIPPFLTTVPSDFAGSFNRSGRGYPDLAAQGWNFEVIIDDELFLIGGTSASAPAFASIVAIINDRLGVLGRPPLGFLNPFLYLLAGPAGAFNDVTEGKNVGYTCDSSAVAFQAQRGWDPTTGFGTPNYPRLLLAAGIKSVF